MTITKVAQQAELTDSVDASIVDLRNGAADTSFKADILAGLQKTHRVVPGDREEDRAWAYSKTIPTYDDAGLSIYDEITRVKDYYPFEAELRLLKAYGPEIASRLFGLPTTRLGEADFRQIGLVEHDWTSRESLDMGEEQNDEMVRGPAGKAAKERWGDYSVGHNNNGVNGNLGLDETGNPAASSHSTGTSDGNAPSNGGPVAVGGPRGAIIELGAGSLKKTAYLLQGVAGLLPVQLHGKPGLSSAKYLALDVEPRQLSETLALLTAHHPAVVSPGPTASPTSQVSTGGLCATYDQGLAWLADSPRELEGVDRRALLWLGSSIGNLSPEEATSFLKDQVAPAMREGKDTILIGVDNCKDGEKVERAYNDRQGVTERFILNGVKVAGRELELDESVWSVDKFEYVDRWNESLSRHEAYLRAKTDVCFTIEGGASLSIEKDELLHIESSYKFSHAEAHSAFNTAGLRVVQSWTGSEGVHTLYLLEKPAFTFRDEAKANVPTREEWQALWKAWDTVTLGMIPSEMLHAKPIDLRHICLFYLGHIPVFADIHVSRFLDEPFTEPAHFSQIFERGIDPNMEDPTKCHDHSIVPEKQDDWPTLDQVLAFRDRFRARLFNLYTTHVDVPSGPSRRLGRVLGMIFEHEGLHLETLLYMLNQMPPGGVLPPPGFTRPDWASLKKKWDVEAAGTKKNTVMEFGRTTVTVGHDDVDADDDVKVAFDPEHEYGWDNESPRRTVDVGPFKISTRPVTNAEYLAYLESSSEDGLVPSSWVKKSSGGHDVRTVYGPVRFDVAQHWPVQASGQQLSRYAASRGGRLPTADELRLYRSKTSVPGGPGSNVGFRNWHPVPASSETSGNGGVWEWTGTVFGPHDGFAGSALYPGYSADFFDGTHWVVLGGSWATIPRIAGRQSVTNWYQANYPYVFAGARVAYDV